MKNVTWYLYVNALSSLGSRMDLIAISALIFKFEHSAYWLTAFFVARQAGGILFSLAAGMLADRVDRRKAMMASDVGQGLAILAILVYPTPIVIVAAAFLQGMLYSLFNISFQSSLPQMFGQEGLVKINALTVRLEAVVGIVGFALGGYLTDRLGVSLVLVCDAASFFVSALMLTRLHWDSREARVEETRGEKVKGEPRETDLTRAYLMLHPVLFVVCMTALFASISTASHNYGLPFLADRLSSGDATLHGFMWSCMSAGALVGSVLAARLRVRLLPGMFAASLLLALLVSLAFAGSGAWAVLVLLTAAGLFDGASQVYKSTLLQSADNRIRGRVMGVQGLFMRIGFFAGFLAAPPLAASLSLFGMVFLAQLLFAVGLIALMFYLRCRRV